MIARHAVEAPHLSAKGMGFDLPSGLSIAVKFTWICHECYDLYERRDMLNILCDIIQERYTFYYFTDIAVSLSVNKYTFSHTISLFRLSLSSKPHSLHSPLNSKFSLYSVLILQHCVLLFFKFQPWSILQRRRQAEAINGALAMIGLTAGLVVEGQTGKGILGQVLMLNVLVCGIYIFFIVTNNLI